MSYHCIGMNGVIETDLSHEDFLVQFIKWIEDNSFRFYGSTRENDEDGNPFEHNKKFITIE